MPSPGPFKCALCGRHVRSVYSLPGEKGAQMCSTCFFNPLPDYSGAPLQHLDDCGGAQRQEGDTDG